MAAQKIGALIREARTGAGLTQEQLAKKISGLSAADISKAERGEAALTQEQLKAVAKATGVTQASLLNASKSSSSGKTGTSSAAKKTASSGSTRMELTASEKKLVELYRKASSDNKKLAKEILEGTGDLSDLLTKVITAKALGSGSSGSGSAKTGNLLGSLLGSALKNAGSDKK